MITLFLLFMAIVAVLTFPMTWMLMLALGNFGFPQYGFVDCLPAALFVSMAFSQAQASTTGSQ